MKKNTKINEAEGTDIKNFQTLLNELQKIVAWFEEQDYVDVAEGIKKIKKGSELLKECRKELKEIDNTFIEIEKEIDQNK